MFTCPNCGSTLTRTPCKFGVFWNCNDCAGRAIGIALLRNLIGNERVSKIWSQTIKNANHKGRSCPICSRGMREESMAVSGHPLKMGICIPCEFVWFDTAEYERISPPPNQSERFEEHIKAMPQQARETIALYQAHKAADEAQGRNPEPDANWKILPGLMGWPIEMEANSFKQTPLATPSLAMAITIVSILGFTYKSALMHFGLIPGDAWRLDGLTFLTSFFLHAGILHLAGNLYFLLIFGPPVEDYLGRKRWLLLILLATLAGNLLHVAANPSAQVPVIGASGGISGLMAFYAFKFPHAKVGILFRYSFRWIQFPAWGAFILWMLLQFFGALKQIRGFTHVSAFAHLGGAAAGIGLWVIWKNIKLPPALSAIKMAN